MPAGSHRAGMTAYQPLRIVYFAGNEIHYCKFNQQCSAALFFARKIKKNCTDKTRAIALCKIDC